MDHKSIQENIIDSIKSGQIQMKPRWYFVFKFILNILIASVVFFAVLYLLNFIGLVMHEKDLFNIFDLSPRGMKMLMNSIPWIMVMLSASLVMVLYVLVKDYSFVYKKPAAYSFFGLILIVVFIGFVVHIFDVNFRFAKMGDGEHTPIMGPMHKYYRGEMRERMKIEKFDRRMQKMQKEIIQ